MKKIIFLLMLFPIIAQADFLGLKKADEFISMRVITLDSAGIRTKPDSVHVFTYLDGGTALQFNTRSTTYPFAIGIDTSKIYGDTTYWFVDQIQDIDGSPTPADYTLSINIVMWGDGGIPTDNWATVQVLGDSLDLYLSEIRDTAFAVIDTLQSQDNWAAKEASLGDSAATIFSEILNSYTTIETFGAAMLSLVGKQDSVKDSTANSSSAFKTSLSGGDLRTQQLVFYTGSNAGSGRTIISYSNLSGFVTLDTAFGQPVNVLDKFAILGARSMRIDLAGYAGINFDRATGDISAGQIDGTFREKIWNVPFSDAATASGSMWDSLNNSSYVQGSSSLDSSTLAGWVWNTPQSNHTIAGTFGKYLDAEISGIGSGSGAYSYKIVTYDSTISQVIPGTNLAVRNISQSALIAVGNSDLLGLETFNLDADSFIVVATSPGYIYQTFDTIVVTGAGVDTVFGDQFDPGTPSSPALCRVYGYLYSVSAIPESDAVVSAYLPAGAARSNNLIVSPFAVTTTSDSSGYFYLDLIRSDSLVPAATQYDLIIELSDGTIIHKRVTVPDSTSWRLDW